MAQADTLVDLCVTFIEDRNAAYLCKENTVVYYTSLTGRKGDYAWVTLSLEETLRIIAATKLDPDHVGSFQKRFIIQAFQELGRVFEFGVKSRHKTIPTVFNYILEADMDLGDSIVNMVAEDLYAANISAMLLVDAVQLILVISEKLQAGLTGRVARELIHKHFPVFGYEIRTDKYRPQINGRKQAAIMQPGTKPKQVIELSTEMTKVLAKKIEGALR